ncbi:EAL domain-containing protein [Alteromonas sp. ZYF713]|nr:EAL domain-containing protein [Alteromonas sp. ZYF713]
MNVDVQKSVVLAVDDQEADLLIVENALSDYYTVIKTTSPLEALNLAEMHLPDVILLDIEMPEMDGFTLCRALQSIPELVNTSFIFITSHNNVHAEAQALEIGAVDFISKPINMEVCRLRVKSQITIKQQARSLHQAYSVLHREKTHLNTILHCIGDAVIATDTEARITYINPVGQRLTGWTDKQAEGQPIDTVMKLQDASSGMVMENPLNVALRQRRTVAMALNTELLSKDGERFRVEDTASPIIDISGHVSGGVIVFQDVTDAIAMATQMTHLTNHDQLTGLPNRVLLHDRMLQAIMVAESTGHMVATLLIDLDNFKYINDAVGHHLGDSIIQHVARRLDGVIDSRDTVSRIGGDEFVVMVSDCNNMGCINRVSSQIQEAINEPFMLNGEEHRLSMSMGISIYPDDANTPEELMRHADTAMYKVKSEGKNSIAFYSNALSHELEERLSIEKLLHQRIKEEALEVFFQPKYSLIDGKLTGMEALVRMYNQSGQLLPPIVFIPVAEETDLINQLGKQVLEKSCRQAKKWLDEGRPTKVAVNIGAAQFNKFGFTKTVADTLLKCDLPAKYLELEITESALIENINSAKQAIKSLQKIGISIALDDFGTGYSSLSYLRSFNFNVLKIDRSFINDIAIDEQARNLFKAIKHLADSLNLDVVCEGVENEQQLRMLKEMGCTQAQGFYFSKPLPVSEIQNTWQPVNL